MATDLISLINWLPQTKLHAPQLRTDTIIRTKLLNRLRQTIADHRLTLVTAPAGCGKTTLLATLPIAFPRLAVAWLALDRHDNDPIHLVMGLAGALRSLAEECCGSVLGLFHAGDRPDSLDVGMQAQRLMGLMINEVMEHVSDPIILILDDYHALTEPAAHACMDYLLQRLPAQMHLVINSRRTPPLALPRLRAEDGWLNSV
jgi:LuxR family maltose regulon positive regulatory protein